VKFLSYQGSPKDFLLVVITLNERKMGLKRDTLSLLDLNIFIPENKVPFIDPLN
jgi:hypothetical protein